jgi:predicted nuclease with TOPRIM domain
MSQPPGLRQHASGDPRQFEIHYRNTKIFELEYENMRLKEAYRLRWEQFLDLKKEVEKLFARQKRNLEAELNVLMNEIGFNGKNDVGGV